MNENMNQNVRRVEVMSVSQNGIKTSTTLDSACVVEELRARVRQKLTLST